MPKINQKEYSILKRLDYKWKWIAKDLSHSGLYDECLFAYANKPSKETLTDGWNSGDGAWLVSADKDLFQFIQWEDEKPYSISKLIEYYEKESEETEVKDIQWFKHEFVRLLRTELKGVTDKPSKDMELTNQIYCEVEKLIDQLDEPEITEEQAWNKIAEFYPENIMQLKNGFEHWYYDRLDEPETLSQEWIDDNSIKVDKWNKLVHVDRLQNLLVPKQEELVSKVDELKSVVPQFIASWMEENREEYQPSFLSLGYDLYANNILESEVDKWITSNQETFARAWLDGYTVEQEQKYYVDLGTAAYVAKWDGDDSVQIYTDSVSGSDKYELHLTEKEIKDYDERFWAFAVPVEEEE